MMHSFLFKGPAYIKYGVGVVKELAALCEELSMTHILFVAGNHIRKSEEFAGMKSCMDSAHIAYDIYSDIPTEPTVSLVDALRRHRGYRRWKYSRYCQSHRTAWNKSRLRQGLHVWRQRSG